MCVVAILKWVAVTINTILLVFGIIVAIFGALLWKTDLTEYPEEVMSNIPKDWKNDIGEPPAAPELFVWLGQLVLAFGLFIIGLSVLGIFSLNCCSDKCKCCLIVYLLILVVLLVVQAAIVALSYHTSALESEVKKAIKPIFLDKEKRKDSHKFIMATQVSLKCCAVNGFKDYYCEDVYDPFCNFRCETALRMNGKALPECPEGNRIAKGVPKTTGVCKNYGEEKGEEEKKTEESKFEGEPNYDMIERIPDALLKTKSGNKATKPSDFPGCTDEIFDAINDNLEYVQITCIAILCVEAFLMIVTIILICKVKKGDD